MAKKKKKKTSSTRQLINIKTISDYSLCCYNNVELVFFLVQPPNLSVMSVENVGAKIFSMTNVLKGIDDIEILCLNSRDNFEYNKIFIKERIQRERNVQVRKLLEQDLIHLDKIQIQTATARLFALVVRIKEENQAEIFPLLRRIEKLLKLQGFDVERAGKEQLKELLAVYFEQNVTTDQFEDIDGERWLKDGKEIS
ncbi:hypothetical protein MKD14_15495 [[Clostridium] innocuum]|nr:hypothetical protein [[Clostridium] innocuum]